MLRHGEALVLLVNSVNINSLMHVARQFSDTDLQIHPALKFRGLGIFHV